MKHRIRISIVALAIVLTTATAAFAGPPTEAIRQTVDSVLAIMKKPEMDNAATRPALLLQVEEKVLAIFDFRAFSSSAVGPKWRTFTEPQRQQFIDAFTELLRATYIEKMSGYNGENVNYLREIYSTDKTRAVVRTSVLMDGKEVPVDYMLNNTNDSWKVYNVRIETLGLAENYHEQFKDVLLKGNVEELVSLVRKRADHVRKENQAVKK